MIRHMRDQGYFPPQGGTGQAVTEISTHSMSHRWKMKSLLKPLHNESFPSWTLTCEVRESPCDMVQVCQKSPLGQHLLELFRNYTQIHPTFSYLKIPSVIVVERLEKVVWCGDISDQVEFLLQVSGIISEWIQKMNVNEEHDFFNS